MNPHTIKIYKARDGWRWTWRAGNGRIVASGEGYKRRRDVVKTLDSMTNAVATGNLIFK